MVYFQIPLHMESNFLCSKYVVEFIAEKITIHLGFLYKICCPHMNQKFSTGGLKPLAIPENATVGIGSKGGLDL